MNELGLDPDALEDVVRSWLHDTAPGEEPPTLLGRVLTTTVTVRRLPPWWTRLTEVARPVPVRGFAGIASIAIVATVAAALLVTLVPGSQPRHPLPLGRNGLILAAAETSSLFVDASGRVVRQLPTGDFPGSGAWTLDGSRFVRMTGTLEAPIAEVTDEAGVAVARIELPAGAVPDFSWSPDGRRFAYTVSTPGADRVDVIDARSGAKPMTITEDLLHGIRPAWSPDGDWIAFRGGVAIDARALHVIRPDGTDERRVSNEGRAVEAWCGFSWSPDGRSIVFSTAYNGVWIVDVDGKHERVVIGNQVQAYCGSMSPDGTRVAAMTQEPTGAYVSLITLVGAEIVTPNGPRFDEGQIVWSPDGRQIAMNGRTLTGGHPKAILDVAGTADPRQFELPVGADIVAWQRLAPETP